MLWCCEAGSGEKVKLGGKVGGYQVPMEGGQVR